MLQRGEVPALVLRGALSPSQAREVSQRLMADAPFEHVRADFSTYGPNAHTYIGAANKERASPQRLAQLAEIYANKSKSTWAAYQRRGLAAPVEALHRMLAELHAASNVPAAAHAVRKLPGSHTASLVASVASRVADSMISPGIYRQHREGSPCCDSNTIRTVTRAWRTTMHATMTQPSEAGRTWCTRR